MIERAKIGAKQAAFAAAALLGLTCSALAENRPPLWSDWTPFGVEQPKWDGKYLAISTGFEVASFRRGRTYGGPTIGLEGGKMWRDGDFVYGFTGAVNYMKPFALSGTNNTAFGEYSRDFAGTARAKFGYLATPNLMLYSAVGVTAENEYWRMPQAVGGGTDQRFTVRPEIAAGFDWAVTNNTRIFGEIKASAPAR